MAEKSKFKIRIADAPVTYEIDVDGKNFRSEFRRLYSFVVKSNTQIHQLAKDISKAGKKIDEKPIRCRLPSWVHEANLDVPQAIALILYFVNTPLTTSQITQVMNKEFRKIDLRNVSKHLTSKNTDLYGYTSLDEDSMTYDLNNYGKKWLETELLVASKSRSPIPKIKVTKKSSHVENLASAKKSSTD